MKMSALSFGSDVAIFAANHGIDVTPERAWVLAVGPLTYDTGRGYSESLGRSEVRVIQSNGQQLTLTATQVRSFWPEQQARIDAARAQREADNARRDAADKARKLTLDQQIAANSDILAKLDSVTVRLGLDGSFDTTEAGDMMKTQRRHFLRSQPEHWKTDGTNQQVQVSFHGPVAIEKVLRALRLLEQREADDAARREAEGGAR